MTTYEEAKEFRAPPNQPSTWISTKATAVIIRRVLKEAFPTVKFGVRIEKYSLGSSVDIRWQDGPTEEIVRAHTKMFEGSGYDSNAESKVFFDTIYEGEWVHFGPEHVGTYRTVSDGLLSRAAAHFEKLRKEDPDLYRKQFGRALRFGQNGDIIESDLDRVQHVYARYYQEIEPKGSPIITRMVLENDGRHPAFKQH